MVSSAEEVIANPGVWEVNTLICLNTNPYYDKSPWSLSKLVPQPFRRVGSRETHSSATPSRARRRARSYPRSSAKAAFVGPRRAAWSPLRLPPSPQRCRSKEYERTVAYSIFVVLRNGRRVNGHPRLRETGPGPFQRASLRLVESGGRRRPVGSLLRFGGLLRPSRGAGRRVPRHGVGPAVAPARDVAAHVVDVVDYI